MVICNGYKYKSLQDFIQRMIEEKWKEGNSDRETGEIFGYSSSTVANIRRGFTMPRIDADSEHGLERLGYRIVIEYVGKKK